MWKDISKNDEYKCGIINVEYSVRGLPGPTDYVELSSSEVCLRESTFEQTAGQRLPVCSFINKGGYSRSTLARDKNVARNWGSQKKIGEGQKNGK